MVWDWFTFANLAGWDDPFQELASRVFRATGDVLAEERVNVSIVIQLGAELGIANEHLKALLKQNDLLKTALNERAGTKPEPDGSLSGTATHVSLFGGETPELYVEL